MSYYNRLYTPKKTGLWALLMSFCLNEKDTPLKINMEHNNGGLEDDFPFQIGVF